MSSNIELELKGTTIEETKIIKEKATLRFFPNLKELNENLNSITNQLKEDGYIDINKLLEKKNDSLYTGNLILGRLYSKIKLTIPDDSELKDYIKQVGITTNDNNNLLELDYAFAKAFLNQLTAIAANSGNPFSQFQITNIEKESTSTLKGVLIFKTLSTRTIDDIVINDYDNLPISFIKYQAKIKKGTTFNKDLLNSQSEILASLPFVTEIKKPEVLFTKDSTKVFLYLSKTNANLFDGFLGFTTNDEDTSLQLNGYLDIALINNLNYGESLKVNYRSDGNDQSQLNVNTQLPYLFKSPLGLELGLELFRKDSTFSTSTTSIYTTYQIHNNSNLKLGFESQTSDNLTEEIDTDEFSSFSKSSVVLTYAYEKKQKSRLFPTRSLFNLSLGYGERKSSLANLEQYDINLETSHILSLNSYNKLYLKNRTSYLISDNYLLNELHRFGGVNTIRGFDENSIFANLFTSLNTEYRLLFNDNIYINSVIDLAYFENQLQDQKDTLTSYGIGTGIVTKAGLLKLNLVNGKFNGENFQFSNTRLQFSLLVSF